MSVLLTSFSLGKNASFFFMFSSSLLRFDAEDWREDMSDAVVKLWSKNTADLRSNMKNACL